MLFPSPHHFLTRLHIEIQYSCRSQANVDLMDPFISEVHYRRRLTRHQRAWIRECDRAMTSRTTTLSPTEMHIQDRNTTHRRMRTTKCWTIEHGQSMGQDMDK